MKKKIGISLGIILLLLLGGIFYYLTDYYKADVTAEEAYQNASYLLNDDEIYTVFEAKDSNVGFIFYPGGKVDEKSYSPLLEELAETNITVVLVKMPFHLAIFNTDAAKDVIEQMRTIDTWFIGGHSLGGAMASSFVAKNDDLFNGLILLGAYPTQELDLPMISIYGSNDLVLNREKLSLVENQFEIPGGNHAYFGNYGEQEGDGEATISRQEQQSITVEKIKEFILENM